MDNDSAAQEIELEQVGCPTCGIGHSVVLLDDLVDVEDRVPGLYAISRCTMCDLIFLSQRPTRACLPRCYLKHYHVQDSSRSGILSRVLYGLRAHVRRRRLYAATAGRFQSLLEVGCGDASFLRHLDRHCSPDVSLCGIDLQAPHVREGRVHVTPGEVENFHFDKPFDAVVLFNVLEHLSDPVASLRDLGLRMTSAGILFGEVPNWKSTWRRMFPRHWQGLQIPRHMTFFTRETLHHTLEAAGYEVVQLRSSFDPGDLAVTLCNWIADRFHLATPPRQAWFYLPAILGTTPVAWLLSLISGNSGCIEFTAIRRAQ